MALFEVTKNDKRIYREELMDFLPEKILDILMSGWASILLRFLPMGNSGW